jgi:hypothetical protein
MSSAIDELTAKFRQTCEESGENEQRVIERLSQRLHISRNVSREYEEALTFGQRLADRIAIFGGSWTFILLFLSVLILWIVLNTKNRASAMNTQQVPTKESETKPATTKPATKAEKRQAQYRRAMAKHVKLLHAMIRQRVRRGK